MTSETSNSPSKNWSFLQGAPIAAESVTRRAQEKDSNLTVAEVGSDKNSSEEDVGGLNVFVSDKLRSLCDKGLD